MGAADTITKTADAGRRTTCPMISSIDDRRDANDSERKICHGNSAARVPIPTEARVSAECSRGVVAAPRLRVRSLTLFRT